MIGQMTIYDYKDKIQSREVNVVGFMNDGECPKCRILQRKLAKVCPYCGLELSWERWKRVTGYQEEKGENEHDKQAESSSERDGRIQVKGV